MQPETRRRRRGTALLAASGWCALACWGVAPTEGRQGLDDAGIPCALASKPSLTQAEKDRIRRFAAEQSGALRGAEIGVSVKARDSLAMPLNCENVSLAFRLEYSDALVPELRALAGGGNDRLAVAALLLLGRLRTTTAAEAVAASLASANPVIRAGAASGFRDVIAQVAKDSLGFSDGAVNRLLDDAAAALASERDPVVADLLVVALGESGRSHPSIRSRSSVRLAEAFARTVREVSTAEPAARAAWSPTVLRAIDLTRQTLFDQAGAGSVDRELARRSAILAGHVLALARRWVDPGDASSDSDLSRAVGAAEGLAIFAHSTLTGERLAERGLQRLFDQASAGGGAEALSEGVDAWVGPAGRLTRPPYNAPASEFAPRR